MSDPRNDVSKRKYDESTATPVYRRADETKNEAHNRQVQNAWDYASSFGFRALFAVKHKGRKA